MDTVLVGQAERYDLLVTLADGAFPLVAAAEGKQGGAQAIVRTSPGAAAPPAGIAPAELAGRLLGYADLVAAPAVAVPERRADRIHDVELGGDMGRYVWTINGAPSTSAPRSGLARANGWRCGSTTRCRCSTRCTCTGTASPCAPAAPRPGPRKDTVIVLPGQTVTVDFDADNPGQWATHCHNLYHEAAGMMTSVDYQT